MSAFDVVVVGAGNAALCAALSAREHGARVLVLERAPERERGGNSRFTAGLVRFPYAAADDVFSLLPELGEEERSFLDLGRYDEADFRADLERLSEKRIDPDLASLLVREALPTLHWLRARGVRFCLARSRGRQAFPRDGRLRFWGGAPLEFDGGGKAHVARLFELAAAVGVEVWYGARARELVVSENGAVRGVRVQRQDGAVIVDARGVVLACGGFEASRELRVRHLGARWADVKVRGTRFNEGDGIAMALAIGARPWGHWQGCHAVAWDANAPDTGDLRVTNGFNKHSYPFGITVNRRGERFLDEGADFRNFTYARYGAALLEQPGGLAYQIFDASARPLLRDEYWLPEASKAHAPDLVTLARGLGIDPDGLERTVRDFNAAIVERPFDPAVLDGRATRGIVPPKSNWSCAIETPPFFGTPATCGITFTFGGLRVDTRARVLRAEREPIPGLYAAGELVGGLFWHNYPGGAGLSAGSVFGRVAGRSAAALR